MASVNKHVQRVKTLYKSILKLHRSMPLELRAIGDQYVKDEFKRHKDAEKDHANKFMDEWSVYYLTLAKQIHSQKSKRKDKLGLDLHEEQFNAFSDEQIGQLHELYKETHKPVDPENPLGDNPHVRSTKSTSPS